MSEDDDKKCAHPCCDCIVSEESEVCSNACSDSESTDRCRCRHKECKGHKLPPAPQKKAADR
jgi:hypothetical protein